MNRAAALLLLLLPATALAGPSVSLVTGEEREGLRLVRVDRGRAILLDGDRQVSLPVTALAEAVLETGPAGEQEVAADAPINLYLANGDRLRGTVSGEGNDVLFSGAHVKGLRVPLPSVRAIRFGRLMGGLQEKYRAVFLRELRKGKFVVVIQRDTRPFPIYARVISIRPDAIEVRVGERKRTLAAHKVYGIVQQVDREEEGSTAGGLRVRLYLKDGTRVTLPLETIDEAVITSGSARVDRSAVSRIEFLGDHVARLSDFVPIDVKQRARFGEPRPWRRNAMVLGAPMRLDGKTVVHGIGVQSYARLEYVLGGRWNALFVRCGIDELSGREGDALFRILGDGRLLKEVRCRHGEPSVPVLLDVKDIDRLVLETVPGESYTSDFCDWAEARVFNAGETGTSGETGDGSRKEE